MANQKDYIFPADELEVADGRMDWWMDEWMGEWVDGWMDWWMDG